MSALKPLIVEITEEIKQALYRREIEQAHKTLHAFPILKPLPTHDSVTWITWVSQ